MCSSSSSSGGGGGSDGRPCGRGQRGRWLCGGGGRVRRKHIVIIYRYAVRARTRHGGGARSVDR